jgi:Sigma-70 factor, region 1.2
MSRAVAWPIVTAESGIDRHFKEIQRFPMLDPQEEYMLARCWREHGDRDAADRLVISHLRLVAKIEPGTISGRSRGAIKGALSVWRWLDQHESKKSNLLARHQPTSLHFLRMRGR